MDVIAPPPGELFSETTTTTAWPPPDLKFCALATEDGRARVRLHSERSNQIGEDLV